MTQPSECEYYCKLLLAFAYAEGFSQSWIIVLNDQARLCTVKTHDLMLLKCFEGAAFQGARQSLLGPVLSWELRFQSPGFEETFNRYLVKQMFFKSASASKCFLNVCVQKIGLF